VNSRIVLTWLSLTLLAVAACGGPVAGQPTPDRGAAFTGDATPTTIPSSTARPGDSLDDLDPCSLLTETEAEHVAGKLREGPVPEKLGSSPGCTYKPQGMSFSVGIWTIVGLAGVQASSPVTDLKIGRHQAKRFVGATESCVIALGVTELSRVDVVLNATSSGQDPCPFAMRVAELVEPKLP
jgi:hypothetical protein